MTDSYPCCNSCIKYGRDKRAEFILDMAGSGPYYLCYDHARLIMVRKDGALIAEEGDIETTIGFTHSLRKLPR